MTVGGPRACLEGCDDRDWLHVVVGFPELGQRGYGSARTVTNDTVWCPPELARDLVGDHEPVLMLPADIGGLSDREMMRLWRFFVDW